MIKKRKKSRYAKNKDYKYKKIGKIEEKLVYLIKKVKL